MGRLRIASRCDYIRARLGKKQREIGSFRLKVHDNGNALAFERPVAEALPNHLAHDGGVLLHPIDARMTIVDDGLMVRPIFTKGAIAVQFAP